MTEKIGGEYESKKRRSEKTGRAGILGCVLAYSTACNSYYCAHRIRLTGSSDLRKNTVIIYIYYISRMFWIGRTRRLVVAARTQCKTQKPNLETPALESH